VFAALTLADAAHWGVFFARGARSADWMALVRDALLAMTGVLLVRRKDERTRALIALAGAVAGYEAYLACHGALDASLLARTDFVILAVAQGLGLYLASHGAARWIDGLLCGMPVVLADCLLEAYRALSSLGEKFSVGAVTPHLLAMLAWGTVMAAVVPLVEWPSRPKT